MWRRDVGLFLAACVLVVVVLLVGNSHWRSYVEPDVASEAGDGPDFSHAPATWVGRTACLECHVQADTVWTGSDHDLAMQLPTSLSVTGNFENSSFTHFDVTTTFSRSGDKYMVRTDGPDGVMTDFEVAYVFGYFPLEQYLIRFPDGRLQALNVCWDSTPAEEGGQRWFHLYPNDETPADDLFHWTGPLQNWNFMCADCHSTNLRRNYDVSSNTYNTLWSELNVSCEACHGPGSRHIGWERAYAKGLRPRNEDGARGLVVNLKTPDQGTWLFEPGEPTAKRSEPLASRIELEACARCHARRGPLTLDYEFGKPFLDHYRLTLLDEDLYFTDGQNQDEVYVYGSFLQSKMYAAGVTCSDCHDYHSTLTNGVGNQVCARCHRPEVYDTPEHHFHQMGKGGDSCLDCHQQARKVMVVDARRDHSFRIPRPDLSLELGTPNACSDCHTDKTHQWSQDAVVKWYGAERQQGAHYAVALEAGRTGAPLALERLLALISAQDQPAMARATALSLVHYYATVSELPQVVKALADADPLVRGAAAEALAGSPAERQLALCRPLLDDPVRWVRIAAAKNIAVLPLTVVHPDQDPDAARAWDIYVEYLKVNLDRAETHLNFARLYRVHGDDKLAEESFLNAIDIGTRYAPAYVNYADFLRTSDRVDEAEAVLLQGIKFATEPAACHHSLGLILVGKGDLPGAIEQLRIAAARMPRSPRFGYVYAVALHSGGDVEGCLAALDTVLAESPWHLESLQAKVGYAMEMGQPQRGLEAARALMALNPNNPEVQQIYERLKRAAEG